MGESMNFNVENFQPKTNLCIEASAGTGKTYTIRKIVAKLVQSGVPLSKILLVTYTEKAAGELRDRIRAEMQEKLEKEKEQKEKKLFEKALSEVDNAPIGTIHSFCQKTLCDFAYESNVPFALNMAGNDVAKILVGKWMRDEWASELAELQKNFSVKLENVQEAMVRALEQYDGKMEIVIPPKNFDDCLKQNKELGKNWDILLANQDKRYRALKQSNAKTAEVYFVKDLVEQIQIKNSNKFTKLGTSLDSADNSELESALTYFFENRTKENLFESNPVNNFIATHLREAYDNFQRQKLENKQQSFNDMITQVRDAVVGENSPTPTSLCQKLRKAYTYAIVDEFQDTNQNQWDIFRTVFLESPENYIIVVGDPKQSIYSFQGADLAVYNSARDAICQGKPYRLATNYRSTKSMVEACNALFSENYFNGGLAFQPSNYSKEISNPKCKGGYKPICMALKATSENFTLYAVKKIAELMKTENGNTAFRYYDKDEKVHKDLRFSDIAVLARTRTEMDDIENAMKRGGIPFVRYKDSNLFKGREAQEWMILLKALAAPDFSGKNRNLLLAALVTDFFRYSLKDVENADFEKPNHPEIQKIWKWKSLLKKARYAQLQERIYADTQIDKFLCESSKLQSFAKIKQIGSYIFDYLYNNAVRLDEVVKHLEALSISKEDADDEDGNLVAKGSDFDAVQVMTIHASKGLQFPVVISVAGFKGKNNNAKGPYIFRKGNQKFLGLDKMAKDLRQEEETKEWRRLFYVAYTRAESLLILPHYDEKWKKELAFLKEAQNMEKQENSDDKTKVSLKDFVSAVTLGDVDDEKFKEIKKNIKEILDAERADASEEAVAPIAALNKALPLKSIYQHSYSSLSHNGKNESDEVSANGENSNPEGTKSSEISIEVDKNPLRILQDQGEKKTADLKNFPKGAKLGNAMHRVFEEVDFERVGTLESAEMAVKDASLGALIREQFLSEGFDIDNHAEWVSQSALLVWKTLNALLPEIHGKNSGRNFSLKELAAAVRLAEMEFQMNADGLDANLRHYCKGFMDLLFKRGEYYSILDWKSDVLENYGVGNEEISGTQEKVDSDYAVQRVLYSYTLIQWLKSFYKESEEEIFEKHFGGVYYVFFRGCEKDSSFGIYAQTWENFAALKKAFEQVKELMYRKLKNAKNGEEEN